MIDMQHKSLMIALKNNVMQVHVMTSTAKAKWPQRHKCCPRIKSKVLCKMYTVWHERHLMLHMSLGFYARLLWGHITQSEKHQSQ